MCTSRRRIASPIGSCAWRIRRRRFDSGRAGSAAHLQGMRGGERARSAAGGARREERGGRKGRRCSGVDGWRSLGACANGLAGYPAHAADDWRCSPSRIRSIALRGPFRLRARIGARPGRPGRRAPDRRSPRPRVHVPEPHLVWAHRAPATIVLSRPRARARPPTKQPAARARSGFRGSIAVSRAAGLPPACRYDPASE